MRYKLTSYAMLSLLLLLIVTKSIACTSIAFAGNKVKEGGTIVAKNRDSYHYGYERLQLVKPKTGHAFVALTYTAQGNNQDYKYMTSGTNDAGLSIMANDAVTNEPTGENAIETATIRTVLTDYRSVAAVKKDANKLFNSNKPALYIVSDSRQVANFEVGDDNQFAGNSTTNGYVWNTNLYHLNRLQRQNKKTFPDLAPRTKRLKSLLVKQHYPLTPEQALTILANQDDGLLNSIQRLFTVAKYVVIEKPNQPPQLMVTFMTPVQQYDVYHITLDKAFFQRPAGVVPSNVYGLLGKQNSNKIAEYLQFIAATKATRKF